MGFVETTGKTTGDDILPQKTQTVYTRTDKPGFGFSL